MRTTTEQRARVIELHKKHPDLSNRVIAERIGVSIPTVRNVIRVAKTAKANPFVSASAAVWFCTVVSRMRGFWPLLLAFPCTGAVRQTGRAATRA